MPKKRYDDEVLRRKALELRRLGMSYREIARELGCSVYKAHRLISQPKKVSITPSPIQQLAEDVKRIKSTVADQSIKIGDIEAKIRKLEAKQKELEESIFRLGVDIFDKLDKLEAVLNKICELALSQPNQKYMLAALRQELTK